MKKEQDRDADKDKEKEKEWHQEKEKESEREKEREKPKRVYRTDEGLLVACRYFDRTGGVNALRQITLAVGRRLTDTILGTTSAATAAAQLSVQQ